MPTIHNHFFYFFAHSTLQIHLFTSFFYLFFFHTKHTKHTKHIQHTQHTLTQHTHTTHRQTNTTPTTTTTTTTMPTTRSQLQPTETNKRQNRNKGAKRTSTTALPSSAKRWTVKSPHFHRSTSSEDSLPSAAKRRKVRSPHLDRPTTSEDSHRPFPVSSMTDQELAQARKNSAKAVLYTILADKNASSTVKQYQYAIRQWQVTLSRSQFLFFCLSAIFFFFIRVDVIIVL